MSVSLVVNTGMFVRHFMARLFRRVCLSLIGMYVCLLLFNGSILDMKYSVRPKLIFICYTYRLLRCTKYNHR